eukprot:TRINITY_DN3269_c0_g1_i4.p1 TRINITY_DN3269_c0_g1~~TRINITY_DN3269_c0_g1_i4.p1  ORF type:complete len:1316 (-),score=267.12 TRINITY_DN3269_c0_g1_i4:164-4111(-)
MYKGRGYQQRSRGAADLNVKAEGATLYQEIIASPLMVAPTPTGGSSLAHLPDPSLLRPTTSQSQSRRSSRAKSVSQPGIGALGTFASGIGSGIGSGSGSGVGLGVASNSAAGRKKSGTMPRISLNTMEPDIGIHFGLDPQFQHPHDPGFGSLVSGDEFGGLHGVHDFLNGSGDLDGDGDGEGEMEDRLEESLRRRRSSVKRPGTSSKAFSKANPAKAANASTVSLQRPDSRSSFSHSHPTEASAVSHLSVPHLEYEVPRDWDTEAGLDVNREHLLPSYRSVVKAAHDTETSHHLEDEPTQSPAQARRESLDVVRPSKSLPASRPMSRVDHSRKVQNQSLSVERAASAAASMFDSSIVSRDLIPEGEMSMGIMHNEDIARKISSADPTKRDVRYDKLKNFRTTTPPPPSRSGFEERATTPLGKYQQQLVREQQEKKRLQVLSNFRGPQDHKSVLNISGLLQNEPSQEEPDREQKESFDVSKTVALLLAANDKQFNQRIHSRGNAIFESMLADAKKKKEKMVAEGVDESTATAMMIQLELKAYDKAYQDIQKHLRDQNAEVGRIVTKIYTYLRNLVTELPDKLKECAWRIQELDGNSKELKSKIAELSQDKLNNEQSIRVKTQEVSVLQHRCEYLQHELEESYGRIRAQEKERDQALDKVQDEKNNIKILEHQIRELMIANRNSNVHSQNVAKELEETLLKYQALEKELANYKLHGDINGRSRRMSDDEEELLRTPAQDDRDLKQLAQSFMQSINQNGLDSDGGSNSDSGKGLGAKGLKKKKKSIAPLKKGSAGSGLKLTGSKKDDDTTQLDEIQARMSRLQPSGSVDVHGDSSKKISLLMERLAALELAAGKKPGETDHDLNPKANVVTNPKRYIAYLDELDREPGFSKRGIRGVEWLIIMIEGLYDEKYINDSADLLQGLEVDPLPEFLIGWSLQKKGSKKLSRQFLWDVYASAKKFKKDSLATHFFFEFLEESYDVEELTYFLRCRHALKDIKLPPGLKQKEKDTKSSDQQSAEPVKIPVTHCKAVLQTILRHKNDDFIQGILFKAQNYATTPNSASSKVVGSNPSTPQNAQQGFRSRRISSSFLAPGSVATVDLYEILRILMDEFQADKTVISEKSGAFFKSMDTDADGLLTEPEYRALCSQMHPFLSQREAFKLYLHAVSTSGKDGIDLEHVQQPLPRKLLTLRQHQFVVPEIQLEFSPTEEQEVTQLLSYRWQQLAPMWGIISSSFPDSDPALLIRIEDEVNQMNHSLKCGRYQSAIQLYRTNIQNIIWFLNSHPQVGSVNWETLGKELETAQQLIQIRASRIPRPEEKAE